MKRILVLAILAAVAFLPWPAMAEDSSELWRCMKLKTRTAEEKGQQPDARAIRELCIQAMGDDAVVRPVEGGNPQIKEVFCRSYADNAAANAVLASLRCMDLRGPRYTRNEDDHFNWCMSVPAAMADSERRARTKEIDHCLLCEDYAHDAVGQFKRKERCVRALGGPYWVPNNKVGHLSWCAGRMKSAGGAADVLNHWVSRARDLKTCHRQYDENFDPAAPR